MAKRGAEEQITKDGSIGDFYVNEINTPSFASSDVLAKRKILKPKGRMFNLQTRPSPTYGKIDSSGRGNSDRDERLKALGISFSDSVKKVKVDEGVADFRPLVNMYLKYYQDIESNSTSKATQASSIPDATLQKNSLLDKSSHTPQPTSSMAKDVPNQVLQNKITSESDNDSDDEAKKEIKIQGPQFNLSSRPTMENSPFTFGSKPAPKKVDSDSDSEIEIKGPTFTFNKQIRDPVFNLSGKETDIVLDDLAKQSGAPKSGLFSFGSSVTKSNAEAQGNKSVFGAASASSFSTQESQRDKGEDATSIFSAPTSFKFGSQPSTSQEKDEGTHESISDKNSQQAAFGFKSNSGTKENGNENNKTLFSFNSVSKSSEEGSMQQNFNFANKPNNQTFGSTTSFNFGGTSSVSNSTTGSQKMTYQAPTLDDNNPKVDDTPSVTEMETVDANEENPNIKFDAVASLNDEKLETKTGEESETVVFQRKTKLMLFNAEDNENPYKTLGKGELKVLYAEEKGTSRVLIRADGSLRVLLNVSLIKDLSYSTLGNGSLVRVPVANESTIDTYVLKVKTAEDGQELCKILNDLKSR